MVVQQQSSSRHSIHRREQVRILPPDMVILESISLPRGVSEPVSIDRLKPLSTVNVTGIRQRREMNDVVTV